MAKKIKRGFLIKRYYCSDCHARVDQWDAVCQNCGQEFEQLPEKKPAVKKQKPQKQAPAAVVPQKPKPKPKQAKKPAKKVVAMEEAEEIPEEGDEGQFEEDQPAGDIEDEVFKEPLPGKSMLFLPRFKTVLWIIVAGMLLWGLFAADSMLLVAAVLILVVIELEAIRRKL